MQQNNTKITRLWLYEKAWATPMRILAKEIGISDVGLAKICRRNNIPLPGVGYWAKVAAKKKVTRIPLPNPQEDSEIRILPLANQPKYVDDAQLAAAEIILKKIDNVLETINQSNSIEPVHPIVKNRWDILKHNKLQPNIDCLDISVNKNVLERALLFFDLLIRAIEALGCSIVYKDGTTIVNILGEKIPVRFENEYGSDSNLVFSIIKEKYTNWGIRTSWADGKKRKIENSIKSIIISLLKFAIKQRSENMEREIRHKKWEEERKLRLEQEQKIKAEKESIEALEKHASNWYKAETIRSFLLTVKNITLKKHGRIDEGSEMDIWLKWGFSYADKIDPVGRIVG
jgi:hypothetical protein